MYILRLNKIIYTHAEKLVSPSTVSFLSPRAAKFVADHVDAIHQTTVTRIKGLKLGTQSRCDNSREHVETVIDLLNNMIDRKVKASDLFEHVLTLIYIDSFAPGKNCTGLKNHITCS